MASWLPTKSNAPPPNGSPRHRVSVGVALGQNRNSGENDDHVSPRSPHPASSTSGGHGFQLVKGTGAGVSAGGRPPQLLHLFNRPESNPTSPNVQRRPLPMPSETAVPPGVDPSIYIFSDSKKVRLKQNFEIEEKLGVGAFGVVMKGVDLKTRKEVAIKCIRKADCKPHELQAEVRLLRAVHGHEGIVTLEDIYESRQKVKIVMEYISGGELFDAIVANEFYSEMDAANLVRQIVKTVEYVHSKNIVHRDIKPENLLFEARGSSVLKLIDFGIATELPPNGALYEVVGSRTYMAPEIDRRSGYGFSVDCYAIGVIMYILLCGYPPFDYDQGIYELAFNSPEWDDISSDAKNLITLLLSHEPEARPSASELMLHTWVAGKNVPKRQITNNVQATIRSYMDFNKMKTRLGVGSRDRRMSVYSLFNIAHGKGVTGPPDHPPPPVPTQPSAAEALKKVDEQKVQKLKMDLRNHQLRFEKLKGDMGSLAKDTRNEALRKELQRAGDELNFLMNAYKELMDSTMPQLSKALH